MTDQLKPGTRAFDRRQEVWKHNSFRGHTSMARQNMRTIAEARTSTDATKAFARKIMVLIDLLDEALKTRRQP